MYFYYGKEKFLPNSTRKVAIEFKTENNNYVFRKVAREDIIKKEKVRLSEHVKKNPNKKILFVLKESLGDAFIVTSLFKSIKNRYPDHDLYIATEGKYADIFYCNPFVYEVIPYDSQMENELLMVGFGGHEGIFDVYFNPAVSTQRQLNYISNEKIDFELKEVSH